MFGRFIRDESGMTMALAVIMIVLIGVMGAGILTFVQRDLESVIEVNRGQRALELADAGTQAAKRQLLSDVSRQHYDTTHANDCMNSNDRDGSDWSPTTNGFPNADCTGTPSTKQAGVTRTFAGGQFTVTIQCFNQTGDPTEGSGTDDCVGGGTAPQVASASNKTFFKVISTGYYPADGSGAKRKVEVIYNTYNLDVPKAYFTPDDIKLAGHSNVDGVSFFALGDVTLVGGANVTGTDHAYGNWYNPPYNIASRPTTNAGIGAVGNINLEVTGEDYDGADGPNPRFVQDPSTPQNPSTQITFPFDYETQLGDADTERMNFLADEAKANGIYYPSSGGVVDAGDDFSWPPDAGPDTVVFVDYTGAGGTNRVDWVVGDDSDPPVEGTLVIRGGDFKMEQHKACLKGIVIIRGGIYEDGDSVDEGGNTCIDGFVNATGFVQIKGSVDSLTSADLINRVGFYGVKVWSWRELYQ